MVVVDKTIASWVMDGIGTSNDNMTAIGDVKDGVLIAAFCFENWNENNLWGHSRIDASPRKQFWIANANYIFNQCGVKRFSATVEATNKKAIDLNHHIGFKTEAILKDAGKTGDLLVMVLWKENCRFLKWGKKNEI